MSRPAVAVPLHGLTVADARPAANYRVKSKFLHDAPHIADACVRAAAPAVDERYENTPDHVPSAAPMPRL